MPLQSGAFTGCCEARIFYNVGRAHSHPRAENYEQFLDWISNKSRSSVNICITNWQQNVEREYLEKMGWKTEKVGSLYVHTISGTALFSVIKLFREEKRKLELEKKKSSLNSLGMKEKAPIKLTHITSLIGKKDSYNPITARDLKDLQDSYGIIFPHQASHYNNYYTWNRIETLHRAVVSLVALKNKKERASDESN